MMRFRMTLSQGQTLPDCNCQGAGTLWPAGQGFGQNNINLYAPRNCGSRAEPRSSYMQLIRFSIPFGTYPEVNIEIYRTQRSWHAFNSYTLFIESL